MGKHEDLMTAVRKADLQAVVKLLGKSQSTKTKLMGSGKKLNINQLDSTGLAALHQAAIACNTELMKLLLDYGAAVDVIDNKGARALHFAAEEGDVEGVTFLIERGASVNDPSFDGATALHVACQHGHVDVVAALLAQGADPTTYNSARKTPLDLACEFGHERAVEILLDGGDSPSCRLLKTNTTDSAANFHTTSGLHLAARNGHTSIVSRLLDAGCDVNKRTRDGTCLHEAVAHGHIDIVSLLISRGVDVSCLNAHKQTALDIVCRLPASRANVLLRRLLQQVASEAPREQLLIQPRSQHYGVCVAGCTANRADCGLSTGEAALCCDCLAKASSSSSMICLASNMANCHECSSPSHHCCSTISAVHSGYESVPDVVSHCANSCSSLHHSADSLKQSQCHGGSHSSASHFVVAPIRSTTDLSQDCGSIVLHASFDATPPALTPAAAEVQQLKAARRHPVLPRSRSPVDQILPADELTDRIRPGRGTDSPGSSTSGTSSTSSGSSGYPGSLCHIVPGLPPTGSNLRQQRRLSGHSCESGVASCTSSRHSYLSAASSSSHGSLNRLAEDEESAYASAVNFGELYEHGFTESEILKTWLEELRLDDCLPLFVNAGYDMPTISRMTPEDLTAIGITQPAVRKRLTSEISKLRISDGIPNFIPNDLTEWLQLLHLEEYQEALASDGCYDNIDFVTDITWEDLEEIGIRKLGHQKKIMLAIDRLKKLKSAAKHVDHVANEHFGVCLEPEATSSPMSAQCGQGYSPVGHQYQKTPTRSSFTSSELLSPAYYQPLNVDIKRGPEIVHAMPPRSPAGCRPEVVAIQVKRAAPSAGMSTVEQTSTEAEVIYESFHGTPVHEMHSVMSKSDVGCNGVTASGDVVNSPSRENCRVRRSSGGVSSVRSSGSPQCRRSSHLAVAGSSIACELQSNMSHASAPATPVHSSNGSTPPCGGRAKKVPPAPPRRTNSIKVDDVLTNCIKNGRSDAAPKNVADEKSSKFSTKMDNTVAKLDNGNTAVSMPVVTKSTNGVTECDGVVSGTQVATKQKIVNGLESSPAKLYPETVESGGPGDCSTLPFANENVGTIRQRNATHSATASSTSSDTDKSSYEFQSNTVQRRVDVKKLPSKIDASSVCDNVQGFTADTVSPPGDSLQSADVFCDIDDMFEGLTHELEELLTQPI